MIRKILTIAIVSGLLISGQALASDQAKQMGESATAAAEVASETVEQASPLQLSEEQTKEMQRLLKEQGYEVSSADGNMGDETMEAIRKFQAAEGLTVTGMPNQDTLKVLAPTNEQQEFFGLSPEFGEKKK